ncbi:hypothetical protein AX17_001722 [Amanita inopinata Kibby_2008]|nr:hypothetical protein AX17_001722 [Amanita inopinata Kibby_2008]
MTLANFHSLPVSILQVSLAAVLSCGQSFRWSIIPLDSVSPPTHEYRLCLRDRLVCLRQTPETLYYRTLFPDPQPTPAQLAIRDKETVAWLQDYFQLDVDLQKLYDEWSVRDPKFASLQHRFGGIRILRQDPWENLISFICSSNNNISRITKMVNSLCKEFSPSLLSLDAPLTSSQGEKQVYHPFPAPSVLAASGVASILRSLGFGYRAKFIQKTANMLVEAHGVTGDSDNNSREPAEIWLESLRTRSTTEARNELLKFVGVGRKVADCVLLMSLDKKEVVPIDTHVYQLATKYYGLKASSKGKPAMTSKIYDELSAKFYALWGDYAGWAHSVMFTSDLKSFATYGLPTSSSSNRESTKESNLGAAKKRKNSQTTSTQEVPPQISDQPLVPHTNDLIDSVKKRRRTICVRA